MWLLQFLANWGVASHLTDLDLDTDDVFAPQVSRLEPRAPATALVEASNVAVLRRTYTESASSALLQSHLVVNSSSIASTGLRSVGGGAGYGTTISFGKKDVLLSIDTGSADTWVASDKLQCLGPRLNRVPTSYCNFGPLFPGDFEGGMVPDQNFNVSYGSGEFVTGNLGYSNLSVAGVTIAKQQVALVNQAFWLGDNETSGLMGLGYRALTSSYNGSNPAQDNPRVNRIGYSPVIESAMTQGLFSMFSLALQRGTDGDWGYLALGGVPPVALNKMSFASTPILLTNLSQIGRQDNVYSFYAVQPDGYSISGGRGTFSSWFFRTFTTATAPVIIDSGTTLNYLPPKIANRINSLFDPPAVYNPYLGGYEVDCQATTPDVAVRIGGVDLVINGQDLLVRSTAGYGTPRCIASTQPAARGPYVLGDAFLKSVVAVFDVGAGEMRFASRPYY